MWRATLLILAGATLLAAPSAITFSVALANKGGRLAYVRSDNSILSDPAGPDGYRDVWRYKLDAAGNIASSTCLTCDQPDMPYHNGNPRYDPFGRGFLFQVENKACPAAFLANHASPGSGSCNDWWWWAAGNQKFYRVSAPLPAYDGRYAQMHGKWSKNGDYFMFCYRLGRCYDRYGCNIGGSWDLRAMEINWTNPAPNVFVPKFGTAHIYTPGNWPKHFYQMTGTSPVDNGVVLFESNSFAQINTEGDIDVATMRVKAADGTWLTNQQANATIVILSEFSSDGSHTAEWNELAQFTPDGTQIQWMSNRGYRPATSLRNLYSDYWISNPDGSNKKQISFFNTPGSPEYTGQRTIASNFVFYDPLRFYAYIFRASPRPDNIYRLQTGTRPAVSIMNAATHDTFPGVSPGALASASVDGLTGFAETSAPAGPWPSTLARVEISVNGVPAPVSRVSPAANGAPGQIDFQVPSHTPIGPAKVQVSVNGKSVGTGAATIVEASPGIFVTDTASLQGKILNSDSRSNSSEARAKRGETIQILATGAGPLKSALRDGVKPAAEAPTRSLPKVLFGDTPATVKVSAVADSPGLWRITATVPTQARISGLVPLTVVQNGVQSNPAAVWIAE
jgi:uncharacterized protein (TIGR03437 family)